MTLTLPLLFMAASDLLRGAKPILVGSPDRRASLAPKLVRQSFDLFRCRLYFRSFRTNLLLILIPWWAFGHSVVGSGSSNAITGSDCHLHHLNVAGAGLIFCPGKCHWLGSANRQRVGWQMGLRVRNMECSCESEIRSGTDDKRSNASNLRRVDEYDRH